MEELSEAVIKGAVEGIKGIASDLVKMGASAGRKQLAKLSVDFEYGFKEFLERNYKRISRVKTLLNPTVPISVETAYVSPSFELDHDELTEDDFISLIAEQRFIVVTGIGGSGKSIFLKHLFVRFCNEALGKVPLFIELRQIKPNETLISYMARQISSVAPTIDHDLFLYALQSGKFVFLLDGFDEVDTATSDELARQIVQLSYEFGKNAIVLTSRPDGPFGSWSEFFVTKLSPLNEQQALSLISKMEYEETAKQRFSELVSNGLFVTHSAYLSNPLLCTLMLLTFDQGAEIPTKMHVFFERTFDVLFYKHDATKESSFRRKFQTTLPVDDFRQAFAAFSTFLYLDAGSSFTHAEAIDGAKRALEYNELKERPDAFVADLTTSISILIREGEIYNYIHRSLQEFFVAEFLAFREIENWDSLVEYILIEKPNDTVVRLLAEINRDRFERQFLAPRMLELRRDLQAINVAKNPAKAFLLFYITFSFRDSEISSWTVGREEVRPKWHFMLHFLERDAKARDASTSLDHFPWREHFENKSIPLKNEEYGSDEVLKISNKGLLETPMVKYLEALKESAIALDEKLHATSTNQKRLVSSALLKKNSKTSL